MFLVSAGVAGLSLHFQVKHSNKWILRLLAKTLAQESAIIQHLKAMDLCDL